jgi:FkbM family methyltransferase
MRPSSASFCGCRSGWPNGSISSTKQSNICARKTASCRKTDPHIHHHRHRRSFGHAGADGSFSEDATHTFFEPVSEFHKKIRENYAGLDYRLIEAAVTDEDRDVTLQVRKVVSQTEITHSSVVDDASENSETRVVIGTRLDAFTKANALLKPYLVKIVVDGNEMSSDHIRRSAIARRRRKRSCRQCGVAASTACKYSDTL